LGSMASRHIATILPRLAVQRTPLHATAAMGRLPRNVIPRAPAARAIVNAEEVGTVIRVDKEHWSSFMFGRERQLLIHVINTAKEADATSVMEAMDTFWGNTFAMSGTNSWSLRGEMVDRVILEKKPARCLEIGTYCGYSALRIARCLPEGSILVSIEVDPLFAAIATKIIEYAGLADRVKVLMGTVECKSRRISECLGKATADFVLCDHSKALFVPDLRVLEDRGVVGPGTVVMGDTTVYPGEADGDGAGNLLEYFAAHPKYRVQRHVGTEQFSGITVSEWVHLP